LDAKAVVEIVYKTAADLGLAGIFSGQLVQVPANGHVVVTDERPTVNPQCVSQASGTFFKLPTTEGYTLEPLTVVTVGQSYECVSAVVRDTLAAIVDYHSTGGSTGIARAQGLAGCPGTERVSVPGGPLVTLAMMVLLLYRQKEVGAALGKICCFLKT
jgi:hypothetical protein